MKRQFLAGALIALATASLGAFADPIELIRDINRTVLPSYYERPVAVGSGWVLPLCDSYRCRAYFTDGTDPNTRALTAVAADPSQVKGFTQAAGGAYFYAPAAGSIRVWRTDGTVAGTAPLPGESFPQLQVRPVTIGDSVFFVGGGNALFVSQGGAAPVNLVEPVHGQLPLTATPQAAYFFRSNESGLSLWTSDGTAGGTQLLLQLDFLAAPGTPIAIGSRIVFAYGDTLLASDGSAAGTTPIASMAAAGARRLVRAGGYAYFVVKPNGDPDTQLWRTDGTSAGTTLITSVPGTVDATTLVAGTTLVYFRVNETSQAWRTDGTAAGTLMVRENTVVGPVAMVGDIAYANAGNSTGDPQAVWRSEGTPASTTTLPFLAGMSPYFPLGSRLLLHNNGTWLSDGTEAGTTVLQVAPGEPSGASECGTRAVLGNQVLFAADDALHGCELWKTDGTEAGTVLVKDILPGRAGGLGALTAMGGHVYFGVNSAPGLSLWKSDGTAAGTTKVRDLAPSGSLQLPGSIVRSGSMLYFFIGGQLWKSDGTPAGTQRVGTLNAPNPERLTAAGSVVYFKTGSNPGATSLWRSDGTAAGTIMLRALSFAADIFNNEIAPFVAAGNKLFFGAYSSAFGYYTPWVSDGTAAGTQPVADLHFFPGIGGTGMVGAAGGRAIFSASEDSTPEGKTYATDGTAAGTVMLIDRNSFAPSSTVGNEIYFSDGYRAIHATDGTPAGTRVVVPAAPSAICCYPLRPLGGDAASFFYMQEDETHGIEIWKASNGVGTLLQDFLPGTEGLQVGQQTSFATFAAGAFMFLPNPRFGAEPHLIAYTPTPTVSIAASVYQVADNGSVEVVVERRGAATGAASVRWTTENGTALAGQDFGVAGNTAQRTGILSWANGDSTPKRIVVGGARPNIALLSPAGHEADETFSIRLSAPTGFALGEMPATEVRIVDAAPQVEFLLDTATVGETGSNTTLRVIRTGVLDQPASVTWQAVASTAEAGNDFGPGAAPQGVLVFAAGEYEKTINVGPQPADAPYVSTIADGAVEQDETFTIRLVSPTAGTLVGPHGIATVTIRSAEAGISFAQEVNSVTEGPGVIAAIRVDRLGATGSPVSVTYQTFPQNSEEGVHYTPVSGTLTWSASDIQPKFINVPIIDDAISNDTRDFVIVLNSSTVNFVYSAALVQILDNEVGAYFSSPAYEASENAGDGAVTVTVRRSGPAAIAGSVKWTTANGSAIAGQDFGGRSLAVQRSGTLTWAPGDSSEKTIVIPVLQDLFSEGPETFTVALSAPTGGIVVGVPATTTVTIADDEAPSESSISFVSPKVLALENGGSVVLVLHRTALGEGFTLPATVRYATAPGTALAGSDYTTRAGTITWAAGDGGDKTIVVPIVDNAVAESHEAFTVTLVPVGGGVTVATPLASVTIVDDDDAFPRHGAVPEGWAVPDGADAGWHASNDAGAYEGVFSLRSDQIDDGQSAQVQVTREFLAGTVAFRVKISSELTFDTLRFFVDGVEKGLWSGTANPGWQMFSTPISAGTHTLRWSYEKDAAAAIGADAAWIDAITLPLPPG